VSSPINSILRQLSRKRRYSILTFPYDYIFDSYYDGLDIDTILWIYRTEKYNRVLLPKSPYKLDSETLPIDKDIDLIIAHDERSYLVGMQLANFCHIPLCYWKHSKSPKVKCHYEIFSSPEIVLGIGPIIGACSKQIIRNPQDKLLIRAEQAEHASSFLPANKLELLRNDFNLRHNQYAMCSALVNFDKSKYFCEIDECLFNNIPVLSVATDYHNSVTVFNSKEELNVLIKNNEEINTSSNTLTIEKFNNEIISFCKSTGGYIYEPL
jgi:hypothetical protein